MFYFLTLMLCDPSPPASEKSLARTDAAAELDRLARSAGKHPVIGSPATNGESQCWLPEQGESQCWVPKHEPQWNSCFILKQQNKLKFQFVSEIEMFWDSCWSPSAESQSMAGPDTETRPRNMDIES